MLNADVEMLGDAAYCIILYLFLILVYVIVVLVSFNSASV